MLEQLNIYQRKLLAWWGIDNDEWVRTHSGKMYCSINWNDSANRPELLLSSCSRRKTLESSITIVFNLFGIIIDHCISSISAQTVGEYQSIFCLHARRLKQKHEPNPRYKRNQNVSPAVVQHAIATAGAPLSVRKYKDATSDPTHTPPAPRAHTILKFNDPEPKYISSVLPETHANNDHVFEAYTFQLLVRCRSQIFWTTSKGFLCGIARKWWQSGLAPIKNGPARCKSKDM